MKDTQNNTCIDASWLKNYCAKLFANSIATMAPEIVISDIQVNNRFEEIIKKDELAQLNYNLVFELSLEGKMAIGLIKPVDKPHICLVKPTEYKFDLNNKLIYLSGAIHNCFDCYTTLIDKRQNSSNRYKYSFRLTNMGNHKSNLEFTQPFGNYPFEIVLNTPNGSDDFANIDRQILIDYNSHWDLLITDSLTAKAIFHFSTPHMGKIGAGEELMRVITNPRQCFYTNKSMLSLLDSRGLQIQQGVSNYQALIEKLKFYDNKIRDLAFMPRNTLDAGTKNIHSAEASSINSNSDDYVEVKANLLEYAWTKFIKNVYFDYLKNNETSKFGNTDFDTISVNVEIAGSTKYLRNRANEYIQNQQGVLQNPNNTNTNKQEITQEE